jgi:lipocalin
VENFVKDARVNNLEQTFGLVKEFKGDTACNLDKSRYVATWTEVANLPYMLNTGKRHGECKEEARCRMSRVITILPT